MVTLIAAIVAGILGIAGVAVGGLLSARSSSRTVHRNDYVLALRASVTKFCTATMIYRGAESDRWYTVRADDAGPEAKRAADIRVRETRTAARNAQYRVELSTGSVAIHDAVKEAFTVAKSIKDASDVEQESTRRKNVETKLDDVARLTRKELGVPEPEDQP